MSLIAVQTFWGRPTSIVGQLQDLEVAREGAVEVPPQAVGVERREEADLAVVDREHRHPRARVLAQRGEDRPVAAQHDAEVGPAARRRRHLDPVRGLEPELPGLLLVEHQRGARAPRGPDQLAQRLAGAVHPAVGHDRDPHASDLRERGRRRRRARPRGRPRPATRTSRGCPSAPAARTGRSRGRRRRARPRSRRRRRRAARRASGSRTTPPRPTPARPTSNCGLTIASASKRGAAHASTAGSTLREGDEGDVDHDQVRARRAAAPGSSARALARSITVTRSSSRRDQSSSP